MKTMFKSQSLYVHIILFVSVAVVLMACAAEPIVELTPTPTSTPMPTNTSTPKPTSTPRPTSTPSPTATKVPPTATPAPVGVAVTSDKYEVTVVKVRRLNTVYLSSRWEWVANPGYAFLELGVKVENILGDTGRVRWKNANVIETDGNSRYPGWVGAKAVESGVEVNPTSIIFAPVEMMSSMYEGDIAEEEVTFSEVMFLRLIYIVEKNDPSTTVLFSFDDLPYIEVAVP